MRQQSTKHAISSSQPLFKRQLTLTTPVDSKLNWLLKLQMGPQLCKEKGFYLKKEFNSYPIFCVMLVVWLLVTLNGSKISITLDLDVCKEDGSKKPKKTWLTSFKKQQELIKPSSIESCYLKVQKKKISFMLVWKKLWVLLPKKSLQLL